MRRERTRKTIKPIHALGFFNVHEDGFIVENIVFDYYDPGRVYWSKFTAGTLEEEIEAMRQNMQEFLREEKTIINGETVVPRVLGADMVFRTPRYPSLILFISFKGKLREGENVYENIYEETVSEYPYEFYWLFPEGFKINEVIVDGDFTIEDNILMVWVSKGTKIKGYEKIVFKSTHRIR
ncbi:MAG: hypothetical protein J7L38_04570 [Thermoproteales archaeon]|nr:hypothetical protein [Thermoproteales archaeon]